MIDFKSQLNKKKTMLTDPIEIYSHLDRSSDTGELRKLQEEILKTWYEKRSSERDIILKLHTGRGKTLIGLLMLLSKLNEGKGPALYLCPSKYLALQTAEQASRFGIPFELYFGDEMPDEVLGNDKIVITTCKKLFHGLSKFGLNKRYEKIGAILLDDAHLCSEIVKQSFKVELNSDDDVYEELLTLFKTELKSQGNGTYLELVNGDPYAIMKVPYWDWQLKSEEITRILSKYSDSITSIKFTWPLIKNIIQNCSCVISGRKIEIFPEISLVNMFGSYEHADTRIFMSATTSDDAQFIKDLGVSKDAVLNPLKVDSESWNGEKMILMPSKMFKGLKDSVVRELFASKATNKYGIVALTPSYRSADDWTHENCLILDDSIFLNGLSEHRKGKYDKLLVFANRYDGIDLPDNNCRILILDRKPVGASLEDKYMEMVISNSDIIHKRSAQKIEQGLGRSVRGEKDYSVIVLLGNDLIKFIKASETQKYFSPQTRRQIEIGLNIVDLANGSGPVGEKVEKQFANLINQCLSRDEGWKSYYEEQMSVLDEPIQDTRFIDIFALERDAEFDFINCRIDKGINKLQDIIDKYYNSDDDMKGWYLQKIACFKHIENAVESNKIQNIAFAKNEYLLKPKSGAEYKKMHSIDANRSSKVLSWIKSFKNFEDMMYQVNEIISLLDFGVESDTFERSLDLFGRSMGFLTSRPDKTWKEGPDNLWQIENNKYLLFECKNEVKESRKEIFKSEGEQINTSIIWFNEKYFGSEVYPILIIPTEKKSAQTFLDPSIKLMNRRNLELLKTRYFRFFESFKSIKFDTINLELIQEQLNTEKLTPANFVSDFSVSPK